MTITLEQLFHFILVTKDPRELLAHWQFGRVLKTFSESLVQSEKQPYCRSASFWIRFFISQLWHGCSDFCRKLQAKNDAPVLLRRLQSDLWRQLSSFFVRRLFTPWTTDTLCVLLHFASCVLHWTVFIHSLFGTLFVPLACFRIWGRSLWRFQDEW
jgi:hypothetical protein